MKKQDSENSYQKRIRSAEQLMRQIPIRAVPSDALNRALENAQKEGQGAIYIHLPFCDKKCSFCGYYTCTNQSSEVKERYAKRIVEEINIISTSKWAQSQTFSAIYFGGGTPTQLSARFLQKILTTLEERLPIAPSCEYTLESTLKDVNREILDLISKSKINRVSLGVQSFDTSLRKSFSRTVSFPVIVEKIGSLRDAGINNICADLIYNLPGQELEQWDSDLRKIKELGLDACSIYPLIAFPNSELVQKGQYKEPEITSEMAFFKLADEFLNSLDNWTSFTPVQYGHRLNGQARYVTLQGKQADILALGPGAGGKINGLNYRNTYTLEAFLEKKGQASVYQTDDSFKAQNQQLQLFRTGTIQLEYAAIPDEFQEKWEKDNLILKNQENIELSQNGRFWAANMALEFLEYFK